MSKRPMRRKAAKKPGWERQELNDIQRNWRPRYGTREYSRRMSERRT